MRPVYTLPDSSLRFHAQDAEAAVAANPRNPKAKQYLEEMHECERALIHRETIRSRRARARMIGDPLTVPIRHRKYVRHMPAWQKQEARDATYSLAFLTLCKDR